MIYYLRSVLAVLDEFERSLSNLLPSLHSLLDEYYVIILYCTISTT